MGEIILYIYSEPQSIYQNDVNKKGRGGGWNGYFI
jgi:hypothetical protein